jgi:hypothetical protein
LGIKFQQRAAATILLLPVAEQPSRIRGPDPSDSQNPARVQRILLDWTSNTAFLAVRCSPLNASLLSTEFY